MTYNPSPITHPLKMVLRELKKWRRKVYRAKRARG